MIVTFRCDGRVGQFFPGKIYEAVLTPILEAALKAGTNFTLINPLSLDDPAPPTKSKLNLKKVSDANQGKNFQTTTNTAKYPEDRGSSN